VSRSGKKPRQKVDPKKIFGEGDKPKASKEKDWGFDEIARSKTRR
jgi:hypothetical protein